MRLLDGSVLGNPLYTEGDVHPVSPDQQPLVKALCWCCGAVKNHQDQRCLKASEQVGGRQPADCSKRPHLRFLRSSANSLSSCQTENTEVAWRTRQGEKTGSWPHTWRFWLHRCECSGLPGTLIFFFKRKKYTFIIRYRWFKILH